MKVLLTGPCGRIGVTTIRRLLEGGHEVRAFDTRNDYVTHTPGFNEKRVEDWRAEGLDAEWLWGDLRDPDAVARAVGTDIEAVIHLAAATIPNHCEEHWQYTWDVNYFGTRNLIEAMRRSPRRPKLVFPSSVAVYGWPAPDGRLVREDDALIPVCTYAATKIAAELEIRRSGLVYTILRLASSITPSARHLQMVAGSEELRRVFAEYMKLASPDSPMHVVSNHDTNTALLNSLSNPRSDARTFNIAGPADCRITFGQYYDTVAELTGRPAPPRQAYGSGPYPQSYYDTTAAEAVLKLRSRSFDDLRDEIATAHAELMKLAQD